MKKTLVLMLLWLSAAAPCFAQGAMAPFAENYLTSPVPQLYRLNPEQYNHHFEYTLPDDGTLQIDFLRLSDWGEKNQLSVIAETAANQVKMLKDSFSSIYSAKLLEMNIPIDGKVIALNYQEEEKGKRQLAYKENTYYQLKTGFDTIRVVKNVGIRTSPRSDSGLVQVQYTFILKDINDIVSLAGNPDVLLNIGNLTDEAVRQYRSQWKQQDARAHQLNLKYDPATDKLVKANAGEHDGGPFRHIGMYVGVGAMVYTNNAISPYFEESIAFLIPSKRGKMQPFVGLNLSGFGFFNSNGSNSSYVSYNFEVGYCKRGFAFMPQKSSMLLGLMRMEKPDHTTYSLFHMGFTLGFNSFLSGGFNIGTDFKKDSKNSIIGVNFKFNL